MKTKGYADAVVAVLIALTAIGIAALGYGIWWSNYKECRDKGFSVLYCGTRK